MGYEQTATPTQKNRKSFDDVVSLEKIGNKYGVSKTTMAIAWILRHPAKMQPVTGTTNIVRLADCLKASEISITHEEWYEIYRAAGNKLP